VNVQQLTFRRFEKRDLGRLVDLELSAEPTSLAWRWAEWRDWVRRPAHRVCVLSGPARSGSVVYGYVAFVEHSGCVLVRRTGGTMSAQAFTLECLEAAAEQSGRRVLCDQFGLEEECPRE
jgi:hypothetical protein